MTEHPEQLLADLVDDRLDAASRARAEAHLAACERCREEVRLARHARGALGSLDDVEPPAGIPLAIRREVRTSPRRSWRAAGIAAVAAGVIAAGAIAVSVVSRDQAPLRQSGGTGEEREPAAPQPADDADGAPRAEGATGMEALDAASLAPEFRETNRRYERDSLSPLGRRFRDEAGAALAHGFPPTAAAFFDAFDLAGLAPPARRAYRCVLAEVPPSQPVAPLAVEGAIFEGTPAYVAAFLQGPAPDQRYDRVVIWVVDREGCSLLSLASQRLPPE